MARTLGTLLCLAGLTTSSLAQDAQSKPTKQPTATATATATVKTPQPRIRARVKVQAQPNKTRSDKAQPKRAIRIRQRTVTKSGRGTGFWLGVQLAEIPRSLQVQLGLKPHHGVMVQNVVPGSPAANNSTLKAFDILLAVNGIALTNHEGLTHAVQFAGAEKKPLKLTVLRAGKTTTVEINPAQHKQPLEIQVRAFAIEGNDADEIDEKLQEIEIEIQTDGGNRIDLRNLGQAIRNLVIDGKDGVEVHIETDGKPGKKNSEGRSIRISPDGVEVTPQFQYRRQPATKPGAQHWVMLKKLEAALKRIDILEKKVTALQKKQVGNK
jgi:membrane-associated protease RseP (regulator of RpoE activity)